MNQDGRWDLVGSELGGPTAVLLSNGDGTFRSTAGIASGGGIVTGDFNGDGRADLALAVDRTLSGPSKLRWETVTVP